MPATSTRSIREFREMAARAGVSAELRPFVEESRSQLAARLVAEGDPVEGRVAAELLARQLAEGLGGVALTHVHIRRSEAGIRRWRRMARRVSGGLEGAERLEFHVLLRRLEQKAARLAEEALP